MILKINLFLFLCFCAASANLEGPFLFFGPNSLEKYKRPALKYLEEDDLMKIYGDQAAIVVFNNQDSVPLSSGYFPRLRKMLEGQTTLVLPQDFLDVHPDYVSNETQVLTLQGPWSDRDAQMTETFARLQDIYGRGNVLGVLGNSQSSSSEGEWVRARRDAEVSTSEPDDLRTDRPEKTEKPEKQRQKTKYALYNATGPPGNGALLFSSGWPRLTWPDGSTTVLDSPVGDPTVKPTRLYTHFVVRFADGDNTRDKITVEFIFKQSGGWWSMVGAEAYRGRAPGAGLQPPAGPPPPAAVLGKSYHCELPLVFSDGEMTLELSDVKVQPFMDNTEKFADSFDCIGFTTVPIWSGLLVTFIMGLALSVSICMILDIRTMDRFENSRSKQLTITVSE